MLFHIKVYWKSTTIKVEQYWQSKIYKDQKTENPQIDPHKDAELSFDKGAKVVKKQYTFQQNCWSSGIS